MTGDAQQQQNRDTGLVSLLRDAAWLDKERVRAYAVIYFLGSLGMIANTYVKAMGGVGSDFLAFWGAAKITLSEGAAATYDIALQKAVQASTGFDEVFAFVNPPPFLFAVTPFGALPYPAAWIAWVVTTFALWFAVSWKVAPRFWPLILAYPGAMIAASHAQNGLLTGALLVGGVALAGKRPLLGGAMIGALVIKPHLAVLLPFWLAAGGKWKAFIAAGISAVGLLALSWWVFGTETMLAYTTSWEKSALLMAQDDDDFFLRMATLYSQLRIWAGHEIALGINVVVATAMIALVWLSWKRFGGDMAASGALALAATPLASPYLFNYDLAFLILPTLWLVAEARDRKGSFRPWDKAILLMLWLAPFVTRAAALPLHLNLMPLASAAMVWLIWQRGKAA
ncbi:glycosyltransferase family 87 protein [Altererythrobacter sp. GH1-8]|uniref:glycosyltransferase family 87 protein n=1 Tax=Altererythrobacter sp. GH1-8 TaxID=3349333 RepID=UPI00374CA75A